jgi:hypothetical protein
MNFGVWAYGRMGVWACQRAEAKSGGEEDRQLRESFF